MMRIRRTAVVVLAAIGGSLIGAAPGSAATEVDVFDDRGGLESQIIGDKGRNRITVRRPHRRVYVVRDRLARVIESTYGLTERFCTRRSRHELRCIGLPFPGDVDGREADDRIKIRMNSDYSPSLSGDAGDDLLLGDGGDGSFYGYEGNDTIRAGGGDDYMDSYRGDEGRDEFIAGRGDDVLNAVDRGRDRRIDCGRGKDRVRLDRGKDPRPRGCETVTEQLRSPLKALSPSFFGVVMQGAFTDADFPRMQAGGVGELRFSVSWRTIESVPGEYDWWGTDKLMSSLSAHGIRPLPVVGETPSWLNADPAAAPVADRAAAAWRRFLRALVERYGPGGDFWTGSGPALPILEWQVWNEPNFRRYFHPRPSARAYASLVRASSDAIRGVDPNARILLGGVAPVHRGADPARFLRRVYGVQGIERHFDAVAVHPYAPTVAYVRRQIQRVRRVMRNAGDRRTPLEVTELGWASRGPRGYGQVVGASRQAQRLEDAMTMLVWERHRWKISGVHWFAWQDAAVPEARCSFCQGAGLFTLDRDPKPAWESFRRLATE